DDDEVPRLESRRQPVEIAKAGGNAGDVCAGFVQRGDALEAFLEQLLDVAELRRDTALGEIEHDLFRAVDEHLRLAGALPSEQSDLLSRCNEPAQGRHLAGDARVMSGVRTRADE